jgi:hypothetical protein
MPVFVCSRRFRLSLVTFIPSLSLDLAAAKALQLSNKCSAVSLLPHRHISLSERPILFRYDFIHPLVNDLRVIYG